MSEKQNNQQYYLLSYHHDEIQGLLDKINSGKVLSSSDYKELIERIGLENISTFSGSYNDLTDLPDLEAIIQNLIELNEETFISAIDGWVRELNQQTINDYNKKFDELDDELETYYATKHYADEYLKTKSDANHNHDEDYADIRSEHFHENKNDLDTITAERLAAWDNAVTDLDSYKGTSEETYAKKADVERELNTKSDNDHRHDNDYATKLSEHTHENKAVLDYIDINKYAAWNNVVTSFAAHVDEANATFATKEEMVQGLDTKSNSDHIHLQYASVEKEHIHENKDVIDIIEESDLEKWNNASAQSIENKEDIAGHDVLLEQLSKDIVDNAKAVEQEFTKYTPTNIANDQLQNILDLYYTINETDDLLDGKVDIEEGKGLSTNDFNDGYKAILDNMGVSEGGSAKDYIHQIIDEDIADVEKEDTLGYLLDTKVDKVEGKQLSTNDYINEHKAILEEIIIENTAKDFVLSVIDDDIADNNDNRLGAVLNTKVDKDGDKVLSDNNFEDKHLSIIQEILDYDGNVTKTAHEFVHDRIAESIAEESTDSNSIGNALLKKSDIGHNHDDKVDKIDGKQLSTHDFSDIYKGIVDEILVENTAKEYVDNVIYDSITQSNEESIGGQLALKSDVTHNHDEDYVKRVYFAVKDENGAYTVVETKRNENQIAANDPLVSELISANILSIGDKVNLQEKVLSEACLTLQEKEYIVQMLTNGNDIFNNLIKLSILSGDIKAALDLKVDKKTGHSLVDDTEIEKLKSIRSITNADIDIAISDVFK